MVPSQIPNSSFQATFINPTTVLIVEDDIYLEQPLIYIKIYEDILLITDTGTAHPRRNQNTSLTLREFLETVPIAPFLSPTSQETKLEPLNPAGRKKYMILCTHAHYDHILGIPSFQVVNPPLFIVASGNDPSFILDDFPTHSLCKYVGVPTPIYTVSHWTKNLEFLPHPGVKSYPLRIRCLHIPGHTPDSLAWYDIDENHLYVGDTFYARKAADSSILPWSSTTANLSHSSLPEQDAAILFPAEGNWFDYMKSLDLIISFAEHENTKLKMRSGELPAQRVKVGCGHVTFAGDAEDMAREVKGLFTRILEGKVPVVKSSVRRGEVFDVWDEGDSRFFVGAPRRLCEDAREGMGLGV